MDLKPGWEKKALIILAVITIIVVIYAYGLFKGDPKVEIQNNTSQAPAPTPTPPVMTTNNSTTSNVTNVNITAGNNGTYQITADQAKKIAVQPGFTCRRTYKR